MPLTMTLRIILMAAAWPVAPSTILSCISNSPSSGEMPSACGPAISNGVLWRSGWIGAITATST